MENLLPFITVGLFGGGASFVFRRTIVQSLVNLASLRHENESLNLKRDLSRDMIDLNRSLNELQERSHNAQTIEESDAVGAAINELSARYDQKMAGHDQHANSLGRINTKLKKEINFTSFTLPLLIGVAALGLAGLEIYHGHNEVALTVGSFAATHLYEAGSVIRN